MKTTAALSHAAIQAMTTAQLAELVKVDRLTVSIIESNAKGAPRWYKNIPQVRAELNRAWYEIRAAERELMRRQHQALETRLDVQATADAVAA